MIRDAEIAEKKFFIYSTVDTAFYAKKKSLHLDNHDKILQKNTILLDSLSKYKEVEKAGTNYKIDAIKDELSRYRFLFDSLITLISTRGFKDHGIIGEMRVNVHEIEDSEHLLDLAKLLMIRRHEKDYLLRKQDKYIEKLHKAVDILIEDIKNGNLPEKQKTRLSGLLVEYRNLFNQLVAIDNIIGNEVNSGLSAEIDKCSLNIEKILAEINTDINNYAEEIRLEITLIMAFILLIAIIINIFLIVFISKRFGSPLSKLSNSIHKVVRSNFAPNQKTHHIASGDELGKLSVDIGFMVENIQKRTIEVLQQKEEIAESYRTIQLLSIFGKDIIAYLDIENILKATYFNLIVLIKFTKFKVSLYNEKKSGFEIWETKPGNRNILKSFSSIHTQKKNPENLCYNRQEEIVINDKNNRLKYLTDDYTLEGSEDFKSQLFIPLTANETTIGVFSIYAKESNLYTKEKIDIVRSLVIYLTIAIQNALAFEQIRTQKEEILTQAEELQQANEEIRVTNEALEKQKLEIEKSFDNIKILSSIGQEITTNLNYKNIVATIRQNIDQFLDATVFGIGLYNKIQNSLDFADTIEKGKLLPFHSDSLDEDDLLSVRCFKNNKELHIKRLSIEFHSYFPDMPKPKAGEATESIIYLPLIFNENKVGVITVQSFNPNAYGEYEINILRNLASYISIALENATVFSQLQEQKEEIQAQTEELHQANEEIMATNEALENQKQEIEKAFENAKLLSQIGQKITANLSYQGISDTLLAHINSFVDATVFGIGIYNHKLKQIEFSDSIEKGERLPFHADSLSEIDHLSVRCFLNQKEILISDLRKEFQVYFPDFPVPKHGEVPESVVYLPLAVQNKRLGVITVQSFRKKAYTEYHLNIMRTLAVYISIALDNSNTYKELEKLSIVASKTDNAVVIMDANTNYEWVNEGFTRLYGYKLDELIKEHGSNLLDSSFNPNIQDVYNDCINKKQSSIYESSTINKNGKTIWAQTTLTPILNNNNEVSRLVAIDSDISKLKKVEEELKESEQKMFNIISFLPNAVFVINQTGEVIAWNKNMEELTGVKANEIIGEGNYKYSTYFYDSPRPMLIDLVLLNDKKVEEEYEYVERKGNILTAEIYIPKLRKGKGAYIHGLATALYDSKGNISGSIEVLSDITDSKLAEQELKRLNDKLKLQTAELSDMVEELQVSQSIIEEYNKELEKLSVVASKTDNAVLITDANGDIEWINEGFSRLYGYTLDEFIEEYGLNIIDTVALPKDKQAIKNSIKNKQSIIYESPIKGKSGNTIWKQTTITPIYSEEDNSLHLVAIDSDISKLKEAEKEILHQKEEIESQRDEIQKQRDLANSQTKKLTDSIFYAKRIQSAVLPPDDLMQRLLPEYFVLFMPRDIVSGDFYWLTQKGNNIIFAVADCTGHGVPGGFMSMLGISFLNEIVNKSVFLQANEILNQLRENIIKSLHQTGRERESKDGMDIALCIIDVENQKMQYAGAYNPLFIVRKTGDNSTKLIRIKADKMPIGIYYRNTRSFTNHEIELQNNDSIYIFSDGYIDQFGGDKGRKFLSSRFKKMLSNAEFNKLHLNEQKQKLSDTLAEWKQNRYDQVDDILILGMRMEFDLMKLETTNTYNWKEITILVAEDRESTYMIIEEALFGTQADIIWCENGKEAVETCKNKKTDIVLMDLNMPVMDGFEAIKEIKTFAPNLPIIVETSHTLSNDKERAFRAGCDDYIAKPINERELLSTISKYIK